MELGILLRVGCHIYLVPPTTSHTYADAGITFDTNGTHYAGGFAFAALITIVWRQRDTGLGRVTVSPCAEPSPDSEI